MEVQFHPYLYDDKIIAEECVALQIWRLHHINNVPERLDHKQCVCKSDVPELDHAVILLIVYYNIVSDFEPDLSGKSCS